MLIVRIRRPVRSALLTKLVSTVHATKQPLSNMRPQPICGRAEVPIRKLEANPFCSSALTSTDLFQSHGWARASLTFCPNLSLPDYLAFCEYGDTY
ncbi:hypothetical protein EDD36DRAFT_125517 [Exophiala viscosa]|uniref:Uncharacterized protein n=1 Tax=Exophiala viscosa TaxID=2486360 RepID=A0AAN6E0U7_9EURO|nr:hypothetical protein EDD36DRAFT_125517 [Exophiala viscosa]